MYWISRDCQILTEDIACFSRLGHSSFVLELVAGSHLHSVSNLNSSHASCQLTADPLT